MLRVYVCHAFGAGMWVIVLYDIVLVGVARNKISVATALWGTAEFIIKGTRLVTSSSLGQVSDIYGRRVTFFLNFSAALSYVLIIYTFMSVPAMFVACLISGSMDIIDVPINTIVSDVGKAWVRSKMSKCNVNPSPPMQVQSMVKQPSSDEKVRVQERTTRLYGLSSAIWVIAVAVAMVASSIVVSANTPVVVKDIEESNSTMTNSTCSTSSATANGISHLEPSILAAIFFYILGIAMVIMMPETRKWTPESQKDDEERIDPMKSFKLLFKSRWLSILTVCLMLVEACQQGAVAVFYFYGVFQFGWGVLDFTIFLLFVLICSAFGTVIVLPITVKRLGLWKCLDMSCFAGFIGFIVLGFSGVSGVAAMYIGMMSNAFNVSKPVLRGKINSEFEVFEQGKVQGGLLVAATVANILGVMLSTSILSAAIASATGESMDLDGVECLISPQRSLVGGAPFFALAALVLLASGFLQVVKGQEEEHNGRGNVEKAKVLPEKDEVHKVANERG